MKESVSFYITHTKNLNLHEDMVGQLKRYLTILSVIFKCIYTFKATSRHFDISLNKTQRCLWKSVWESFPIGNSWLSASNGLGRGFSYGRLGTVMIMPEHFSPDVWCMRSRIKLITVALTTFVSSWAIFSVKSQVLCAHSPPLAEYIYECKYKTVKRHLSEYHLKIIMYHTLGSTRLDETPSRKDKAETVKIRSQLESDGSGGLRRAFSRQTLEGLPRTKSTGDGPQVGRCYFKETAAFIYPFLCSFSYSFIQIPTMCRYWVEWWEERVERGQRVNGLKRKQRISVTAVGFKELGWT